MRALLLSIGLLVSIIEYAQPATESTPCMQHASRLLDEVINLMQKHYYKRDSIQWDTLGTAARNRIKQSGSCDDAYEAVKWCFGQMHERHSFIMPAVKAAEYNGNINSGSTPIKTTGGIRHEILENDIAYIDVPWIST